MIKNDDILEQYDFIDTEYMYDHIDEYEVFVGRYIILFSYLEHNLNLLIAHILNERSDQIGYLVTTKMSISDKIDMLDRFSKQEWQREIKTLQKIHEIIPKLKDLNVFRNILAHANWASMQNNGIVRIKTKVDEKKGIWFENKTLKANDICKKCHLLEEAINYLEEIENEE